MANPPKPTAPSPPKPIAPPKPTAPPKPPSLNSNKANNKKQ